VELEYGDKAFWDARYEDSCSTLFDWYQDYEALAELLLVRAGGKGNATLTALSGHASSVARARLGARCVHEPHGVRTH
jgi:hypothetical protein